MGFGFWPFFPMWGGFGWGWYGNHACPKCGEQVPNTARFCPWCRARQAGGVPSGSFCPQCTRPTVAGAPYCPGCGTKLPTVECASCRAQLPPEAKFCSDCGTPVR
jgi:predicted amidophosphoribosyltransferase